MTDLFEDSDDITVDTTAKTLTIEVYRDVVRPGLLGGMTSVGKWQTDLTENEGEVYTVKHRKVGKNTYAIVSRDDGREVREAFGIAESTRLGGLISRLIDKL